MSGTASRRPVVQLPSMGSETRKQGDRLPLLVVKDTITSRMQSRRHCVLVRKSGRHLGTALLFRGVTTAIRLSMTKDTHAQARFTAQPPSAAC